ncbi:Flagellar motor switch protein FliG [Dissulfuribacter thermophilus]|uniref:Flagellar motor switch protein FliG n=1 Tax=Dissulfuribacter thermophilus TaxID=1156395 RepID=A0A1B9F4K0_9BACT|nr:flagellar motor switch protein FliG [Dissulfuribacter thermophilus]OCC14879.1 Flagellar motor switch protein FliG [Dissulfuribacter thermophilus]
MEEKANIPAIDLSDPKGPYKAAIFLLAMGEAFTAEVFKYLKEEEIKKVSTLMAQIKYIPGEAVDKVLKEVREKMSMVQGEVAVSVEEFLKKVLFSSMPEEQAKKIYDDIMKQLHPSTFQKLSSLEPKVIVNFLRNEHPQTIAVILANIEPELAADILEELPERLQSDVMIRIANLEKINPEIVAEIDKVLEEELFSVEMSDAKKVGGAERVAAILNSVDRTLEDALMEKIEESSEELAEEIRKLMFKFEDLLGVDDSAIVAILKEISTEELKLALKAASDELKAKFFNNMSERAAQLLKEDLEVMGPVRLKDVENAQQSILKVAKRLESEGKIVLGGKGGEEVLV